MNRSSLLLTTFGLLGTAGCSAVLSVGSRGDGGEDAGLDGGDAGPCIWDGGSFPSGATDPGDSSLCCNPTITASGGWVHRLNPTTYLVTANPLTPTNPTSVVVGNFLGDGNADLAVSVTGQHQLVIFRNLGGVFVDAGSYQLGGGGIDQIPGHLVAADLNGDGVTDLVSGNGNTSSYSTYLSQPGGGFLVKTQNFSSYLDPIFPALGPLGGATGTLDLVMASFDTNQIMVLAGDGKGGFADPVLTTVGTNPASLVLADFDGDGILDVAGVNSGSYDDRIWIMKGHSDRSFSLVESHLGSEDPSFGGLNWIVAGDFDGDGHVDLAAANYYGSLLCLLLGRGDGTFEALPFIHFGIGHGSSSVALADIDGDGSPELVVAQQDVGVVDVLRWDKTSRSASLWFEVPAISSPQSVVALPHPGSAVSDLALVNHNSDTMTVLVNGCP